MRTLVYFSNKDIYYISMHNFIDFTNKIMRGVVCMDWTSTPLHPKIMQCVIIPWIQCILKNCDTNLTVPCHLSTVVGNIWILWGRKLLCMYLNLPRMWAGLCDKLCFHTTLWGALRFYDFSYMLIDPYTSIDISIVIFKLVIKIFDYWCFSLYYEVCTHVSGQGRWTN